MTKAMTNLEFRAWLEGFCEATAYDALTAKQWQCVRDKIAALNTEYYIPFGVARKYFLDLAALSTLGAEEAQRLRDEK